MFSGADRGRREAGKGRPADLRHIQLRPVSADISSAALMDDDGRRSAPLPPARWHLFRSFISIGIDITQPEVS